MGRNRTFAMPVQCSEHRATKEADRVLHRHRNGVLVGAIPVGGAIVDDEFSSTVPGLNFQQVCKPAVTKLCPHCLCQAAKMFGTSYQQLSQA